MVFTDAQGGIMLWYLESGRQFGELRRIVKRVDGLDEAQALEPNCSNVFSDKTEPSTRSAASARSEVGKSSNLPNQSNSERQQATQPQAAHDGSVEKVVWCQSRQLLVSAGADGFIRFWDIKRGTLTVELPAGFDRYLCPTFTRHRTTA